MEQKRVDLTCYSRHTPVYAALLAVVVKTADTPIQWKIEVASCDKSSPGAFAKTFFFQSRL
jgi:hypothetical protein